MSFVMGVGETCGRAAVLVAVMTFGAPWLVAAQDGSPGQTPAMPRTLSLEQLARDGEMRLSLDDAIAMALANNLDVELQRLGPRLADTDLTRARAGALPRGVPLGVREGPRSATGATDLLFPSVGFGTEPSVSLTAFTSGGGRLPPSQDPVLTTALRRTELDQPQPNSFAAGTSDLVTKTTTSSVGLQQETLLKDYLSELSIADPRLAALRVVPSDPLPANLSEAPPAADALAEAARRTRPDLAQARLQIDNTRALLTGTRNARLPALDAIATFRSNGLAGSLNPLTLAGAAAHTAAPELLGGYGSVLDQLAGRSFPDFVVGIQMTIPLRNRAAEADYARDQLALRQQEIRVLQIEKQVRLEIENALIALEQARATAEAAQQERTYQEQAVAAEIDRLGVGVSTTYLVIQYQRDLAQARSAEVAALASYAKARAAPASAFSPCRRLRDLTGCCTCCRLLTWPSAPA